VKEPSVKAT